MNYYFSKTIDDSIENAEKRITAVLKDKGFGILTEIDVQAAMKKKLNKDFRKYKILGACNPQYAFKALSVENKIGTMLPCNVIIQETSDGKTEIAAINPIASMQAVENKELDKIAQTIGDMLKDAVENA